MLRQSRTNRLISIFRIFTAGVISLLFLTSVLQAQSVQTIESEAQLASILCRNPREQATNELLLDRNAQLVNVTLWNALLDCAYAQRKESPAKSIEIYKLALRTADRLNKRELVATTYYHLGRTYWVMGDFENAIQAYETSRSLFEQAGNETNLTCVLANLGALYLAAEDYDKAQTYSEEARAIAGRTKPDSSKALLGPIDYGLVRALHTLGEIDLRHGDQAEALNKLREALALLERLNVTGSSYNLQIADVLVALAKVYGEMGAYEKAFSSLTKAHQVSRSSGDRNTRAKILSSQAALFLEQEDDEQAQKYLNASLAIYRSLGNAQEKARAILNLAMLEQRQGRNDEALVLFQQSLDRANTAKLVDVQIAAGQGIAIVFTAKRNFPNALQAINQSLELAQRRKAKNREAELLWRKALIHYAMQNYSESAAVAEQALTLARSLRLPKLTYLATSALGEAYASNHTVELAIPTLKEAINQVEELRDQVAGRPEGRYLFFENKVGPYNTLVKLLAEQGKDFEALLYAERAKGRVLLEGVRNHRTDLKDLYSEGEKAEAEALINKLHAINERIQSQVRAKPDDEQQNELNAVRRELVLFQERLAVAHPELPLRAGPARTLTQASLNTLVTNDVAYLEYVVTGDTVGLFLLKRNGPGTDHELKYISLPGNADELRRKVNEFHSALAERRPDYAELGRELYQLLIAPATNELQNVGAVCIIPDQFLWTLPFQALTTTSGNYFVQEKSLYYAPSLTVLNELTLRRRQRISKESLIAFANPVLERNDKLNQGLHPLPETETEVAAVASAVRTESKKILAGVQAEEKTFKSFAEQYATIHLATHGVLDNRDPLNSYLLLTKTVDDPENDGLLQAREIIDLHLDADLAVLSACETGKGRISPGEGVIGMSWAFFVAGARSVVVSQWRVNSASTSQLMKYFYQSMARQNEPIGRNKSQALREASLRLLKDRRYRHPFYWAGFVLVSSS